jgi:hypothetical protein
MFKDKAELQFYIVENFPEVTDKRINEAHWDFECSTCKVVRGFQVIKRDIAGEATEYGRRFDQDFSAPYTYLFRCPVCKTFKQWIVYTCEFKSSDQKYKTRYYRVTSVPNDGLEEIEELPDTPPSLRTAYKQAIRAMDANAPLAAAAMFRRALQVITRDLLGARHGNLAAELNEVVGRTYNGGTVTSSFGNIGYIIKEAGNQGAHPDEDPDLLEFTQQDAEDLQRIFMEMVSELFVIPVATKKARDEFLARKKIAPGPSKV